MSFLGIKSKEEKERKKKERLEEKTFVENMKKNQRKLGEIDLKEVAYLGPSNRKNEGRHIFLDIFSLIPIKDKGRGTIGQDMNIYCLVLGHGYSAYLYSNGSIFDRSADEIQKFTYRHDRLILVSDETIFNVIKQGPDLDYFKKMIEKGKSVEK